jgi:hypothetical protein
MSRAREVSKIVATVDSVENSIDNIGNIDLSSTINTASAAAVAYLIDGAPAALNTLNELAAALNDNESFATTVTNELSSKLSISSASTIYLPQATASAVYLPQSTASTIYLPQATASATYSRQAYGQFNKIGSVTFGANFNNVVLDETAFSKNISLSSGNLVFALPGIYEINVGFRFGSGSDVWTGCRLFGDGSIRGISYGTGQITSSDPGPVTFNFMAEITNIATSYTVQVFRDSSGNSIATPNGSAGRAIVVTISKVD